MKKLAASIGLVVLAVTAQLALAKGTTDKTVTAAPDACAWTKGGGAAVGKTSVSASAAAGSALTVTGSGFTANSAQTGGSLKEASPACPAPASAMSGSIPTMATSSTSSAPPIPQGDQKIKTKSNIKND